jgi:hypothetical protein
MAERRMFAKTIIGSDAFLDMPQSTQALYFHLSMRADDDGFVNSPKSIMRLVGCKDDDIKILCSKKFLIPFETGVVVIKHWKIHNYIQNDRRQPTKYPEELRLLELDENKAYRLSAKIERLEESIVIDGEECMPGCETLRKEAYEKSSLPYSFIYKIRRAFWNKPCPICGASMCVNEYSSNKIPSIQHNIPITKGGKHELGNISVICKQCNVSIRDKETGDLNADEVQKIWAGMVDVSKTDTQDRIGKDRIGKDKEESGASAPTPVDSNKVQFGEFRRVFLKQEEYDKLSKIYPDHIAKQITALDSYLENHPQKKYKSHYATIVGWMNKDDIKPKPIKHYCKSCDNELLNKGPNAGTCQNDECDMYHKEQI